MAISSITHPCPQHRYSVRVTRNGVTATTTVLAESIDDARIKAERIFPKADSLAVTQSGIARTDRNAELREAYANRRTVDALHTKVRRRIRTACAAIVGGLLALAVAQIFDIA